MVTYIPSLSRALMRPLASIPYRENFDPERAAEYGGSTLIAQPLAYQRAADQERKRRERKQRRYA